ncbi:uncharacterized protein LOC110059326 [Orbicella faveolata]|uniref:uncharacterized protein LOC110059326 n=1 Tax=Orbicella faveolata TaxID=48498 RepID=UPI0009E1B36E|nr:uncharacterized protein LOC110059326 [Orbicella faveolata]
MFYKQGSFAGRIVPTEASAAYQPQGLGGLREVKGPVIEVPMSSSAADTSPNTVRYWQETFKKSKAPVYLLKGSRDVIIYRGLMGTGLVGLGYVAYTIYMMATGKMKKQEKS